MAEITKRHGHDRNGLRAPADPACPGELTVPAQSRGDFAVTVSEQLGEFEERLDELESALESGGWDDVADYRGQLEDLRLRLRFARARSGALETVPDREWPELRKEMEEALLDLADSLREITLLAGGVVPG